MESHLLQMRGLKHVRVQPARASALVASFTDAWIETRGQSPDQHQIQSHLLQMRGLKLN